MKAKIIGIAVAVVIIICAIVTLFVSLNNIDLSRLMTKEYLIESNSYSMTIDKGDSSAYSNIVSPQDDYYYVGLKKDHMINSIDTTKSNSFFQRLYLYWERLISHGKTLTWVGEGTNTLDTVKVTYAIKDLGNNNVSVTRHIIHRNPNLYAIGQAFVFCKTCLVTDGSKHVYFTDKLVTKEKLDLAFQLGLTPIIVQSQLPKNIRDITILDIAGKKRLSTSVAANQEVYFYEDFSVLEVKTFFKDQKQSSVTQTFSL